MCPPYPIADKEKDLCGSDNGMITMQLFLTEVISTAFMVVSILHIKNQSISIIKNRENKI